MFSDLEEPPSAEATENYAGRGFIRGLCFVAFCNLKMVPFPYFPVHSQQSVTYVSDHWLLYSFGTGQMQKRTGQKKKEKASTRFFQRAQTVGLASVSVTAGVSVTDVATGGRHWPASVAEDKLLSTATGSNQ